MKLVLNTQFYPSEAIEEALSDWKDTCAISKEEKTGEVVLSFDDEEAKKEFSNYVLGISIAQRKGLAKNPISGPDKKESPVPETEASFGIVPYFVKKLSKNYVITTRLGGWCILTAEELRKLHTLNPKGENGPDFIEKLRAHHIIVDPDNALSVIKAFRTLNRNLFFGPSLHIVALTTRCNFDCVYCHAGSPSNPNIDLTKEVAIKIIERIFDSPVQKIMVEFQGGEPLLKWDMFTFIVETIERMNKFERKKIEFAATSNFTLMTDEKMQYLLDHNIKMCTSIDGPQAIHDKNRPLVGGKGTYEKVVRNVKKMQENYASRGKGEKLAALVTLTKQCITHLREVVDEYVSLGFPIIHLRYLEYGGETLKHWKYIGYTAEEFIAAWKDAVLYILELNKKGTLMMERGLMVMLQKLIKKEDPMYTELMNPCGAGRGQIAYKENGDVVVCDNARHVEEDLFTLGNVMKDSYNEIMNHPVLLNTIQASLLDVYRPHDPYNAWNGICPIESHNMQGNVVTKLCGAFRHKIHEAQLTFLFELMQEEENMQIFKKWLTQSI
jgi:His-Xaa-Ser system radical SAM maturase HxsB